MPLLAESSLSFQEIVFELEPAMQRLGLSVLAKRDLGEALMQRDGAGRSGFDEQYMLYELVSWPVLEEMLVLDPAIGLQLPWRFVVFTDNGVTRLGFEPLHGLVAASRLAQLVGSVEEKLAQLVDASR